MFGRPVVLLAKTPSGRLLPWVIAVMVYLAALGLAGIVALHESVAEWKAALAHNVTVQIVTDDDASRERQLAATLDLLKSTPGVSEARPLSEAELIGLLEPWLGAGNVTADLPIPALIDVILEKDANLDLGALSEKLRAVAPSAAVDDHERWLSRLIDLAENLQFLAAGVVGLVALATMAIVVFATRAGMAIHQSTIEILHLIGARDNFIASQFQRHFLKLGIKGSLIGLGVALLSLLALWRFSLALDAVFLPAVTPSISLALALAALPVGASLLTMLTARRTVKSTLGQMV